jgi:hypothetical protein
MGTLWPEHVPSLSMIVTLGMQPDTSYSYPEVLFQELF